MAEVKWIKLTTDMFDNRKIRHLRRLPEGNNIVLIWVMLLTMADISIVAECEKSGQCFKRKTHYQAILDMVAKDRKVKKGT